MVEAKTKYKNINPSKALFLHLRSMEIKQNKTEKKATKRKEEFSTFLFFVGCCLEENSLCVCYTMKCYKKNKYDFFFIYMKRYPEMLLSS